MNERMHDHNSKDVGLLDYLLILAKYRKLLFMNFVIMGVAATVLSFLLPKYYKATAVFLPPEFRPYFSDTEFFRRPAGLERHYGRGLPDDSRESLAAGRDHQKI